MPSSSGLPSPSTREDCVRATMLVKVTKMFYFFLNQRENMDLAQPGLY